MIMITLKVLIRFKKNFSVAKATLHSQMSVRSSVRQSVTETPQQL